MITRTRSFRVEIETPADDYAKSVAYHRQTVIEDGGEILGLAKVQPTPIRVPFLPTLAATVRTVTDQVTGQTVTISGAGIAAWITADYEARHAADLVEAEERRLADLAEAAAVQAALAP
jgi:hypothetical protein